MLCRDTASEDETCITIHSESDAIQACLFARRFATTAGFDTVAAYAIATCVSELAHNIVFHANGRGTISCRRIAEGAEETGMEVVADDEGPGIPDIDKALEDGFSTRGSLGCGLPGAKRLMDSMMVDSSNQGTHIVARKWQKTRTM